MAEVAKHLAHALFWMNAYLGMIAHTDAALVRMRNLVGSSPDRPSGYQADISLLVRELARELARLGYWETRVDLLRAGGASADPVQPVA